MFETVTAPLRGARTVPLVEPEFEFLFVGWDFTGAAFRMEVRDRRDGGALRAGLDNAASAAAEGVRVVSVETVAGVPQTLIRGRVNETTMEGLPAAPEPGDDMGLTWGLHITPVGGLKFLAFEGDFIVKASTPA